MSAICLPALVLFLVQEPIPPAPAPDQPHAITLRVSQEDVGALSYKVSTLGIQAKLAARLAAVGMKVRELPSELPTEAAVLVNLQVLKSPKGIFVCSAKATLTGHPGEAPITAADLTIVKSPGLIESELYYLAASTVETIQAQRWPKTADDKKGERARGEALEDSLKAVPFDFKQVKIKHQPRAPSYPSYAKANGIQGTVVLSLTISPEGIPQRVRVLRGPEALLFTAMSYALDMVFEPAILNGQPQWASFILTMPFRLKEGIQFDPFIRPYVSSGDAPPRPAPPPH